MICQHGPSAKVSATPTGTLHDGSNVQNDDDGDARPAPVHAVARLN